MRALDLKLLRDLRRLWAQSLAIALVMGCGVAVLLMSMGMSGALSDSRAAYYERNRFAEVFAGATRVPQSRDVAIAAIPGVRHLETRILRGVVLDLPGRIRPASGLIVSLPEAGLPSLNVPLLRSGRWPDAAAPFDVVVSEPFADANGFRPGDRFAANLDGTRRELTVTGTALSPEFIYTIGPGAMMPDPAGHGIIWMPARAAEAAFDMAGAFNDMSLTLEPGGSEDAVIDALDDILAAYGGDGAVGRVDQLSNAFLEAEIEQLDVIGRILPPIFLGISIFLVNMVVARIIALEREEIGLLKALGYTDGAVLAHYLAMAGLIAVVGILFGWAGGTWLARMLAELYTQFYDFPYMIFHLSPVAYAIGAVAALSAAGLGAARAAWSAARLPPAVAMSPAPPPRFSRTPLDRAIAALRLSEPSMMIARSILRWPVRAGLSALGYALATAVLIVSNYFNDALDTIVVTAFDMSNRQDAIITFLPDQSISVLEDVRRLPGILQVEGQTYVNAVLRNGHLEKTLPIEGRRPGADLARIVADDRAVDPPASGLLLSERLADQLDLAVGDLVEVELRGERRETHHLPVTGTVTQLFGLGAYMEAGALDALMRRAPRVSVANVTLQQDETAVFYARIKETPGVTGAILLSDNRASFEDTLDQNVRVTSLIYTVLAAIITIGVAYNGARIQLSERARELASLRVLGFGRAEVSWILLGEVMILAALAQPMGWAMGAGLAAAMSAAFSSDLYILPFVVQPSTFARASLVVLIVALASVLVVRRRIDSFDLVAVLKTRE